MCTTLKHKKKHPQTPHAPHTHTYIQNKTFIDGLSPIMFTIYWKPLAYLPLINSYWKRYCRKAFDTALESCDKILLQNNNVSEINNPTEINENNKNDIKMNNNNNNNNNQSWFQEMLKDVKNNPSFKKYKYTKLDVLADVITLIGAGTDTTAISLCFFFFPFYFSLCVCVCVCVCICFACTFYFLYLSQKK